MISIIVPVYNVEKYLSSMIESILLQSYKDFEVILVDDGSTDSSGCICDEWVLKDNRLRVLHKTNGGLSSSRNAGLEVANGKYIAFIDSDDIVEIDMLEEMSNILNNNDDVGIVSCDILTFIDGTEHFKAFLSSGSSNMFSFYEYYRLILEHKKDNSVCNKLFRKDVIGDIRFCEGRINEDILFTTEVFMRNINCQIYYISKPFYHYRLRQGSITMQANPRAYDFITNAFEIKARVQSLLGNVFDKELEGYICYEMVNFISTIEKYNARSSFLVEIEFCRHYIISDLLVNITNKSWPLALKLKAVLVVCFPALYRFILNIIH